MRFILFLCAVFLVNLSAWAQELVPQSPSDEVLEQIQKHNQAQTLFEPNTAKIDKVTREFIRPFAEYEQTGYLFFNDDDYRGFAAAIKNGIAANLPSDVTLVVYTTFDSENYLQSIREHYSQYIDESQLVVLALPNSGTNDFWTRDNLPVPVFTEGEMSLVDARYYYNFEPDQFLANLFSVFMTQHPYFFEGGNFITNSLGDCIVVNRLRHYPGGVSDTGAIPDAIFYNHYGCRSLTRLDHLKGIGHADEVVKFLSDDVIVTDTLEYVETLEAMGFEVHMLPEPSERFQTYVNSLQVNDVLFVPTFNDFSDSEAIETYQSLLPHITIVPLPTGRLATRGQGGIHCITMNYPPVPLRSIIDRLGAKELLP